MKATILFSSLAVIIGSLLYTSKPANANGSGYQTVTTGSYAVAGTYTTKFTVECPVIAKKPLDMEPDYEYTVNDGVKYYDHCKSCDTGVFLENKEGIIRCTFCGKNKTDVSDKK